ncbi:hypothetical protein [Brumicola pallidula]|uniref:Cytochrome C n=1 Tax=Brumicola pallidula DSM 14239 = ACAM 615 TaxID=1121922 RepID=K6Y871_9ALTE|nr:hypothetical protein [Glaciecola pallidula]GAC28959.1 hypothetical protein GPAL_2098 [Glaciecola pallidula DSM 14239 = ACAM 615]
MKKLIIILFQVSLLLLSPITSSAEEADNIESQSSDHRIDIRLNETQRTFILGHMRHMLETLTAIQQELLVDNPSEVHQLVTYMQENTQKAHPKMLGQSLPDPFKQMGRQMNQHWRNLSVGSNDKVYIQKEVVNVMTTCNSCHAVYQIHGAIE